MDQDVKSLKLLNELSLLLALVGVVACTPPEGDSADSGGTGSQTEGEDAADTPGSDGSSVADSTGGGDDDDDDDAGSDEEAGGSDEDGTAGTGDAPAVCGDGAVDPGEACDDGRNDGSYGGCEPGCRVLASHCGDGVVDDGEEVCDDGTNDGAYGGCERGCQALAAYCGDGRTDPVESCDDGNEAINDGCNPDCSAPGETLWSTSWHNPDLLEDAIDWTEPVGLLLTTGGEAHLAVEEAINNGEDQVSNLVLDLADGSVTAVTTQAAAGGLGYRARGSAPRDGGMVIAGATIDLVEGGTEPVMYLLDEAGNFTGTYDVLGDTGWWFRAAGHPDSAQFAVGNNTVVLVYEGSEVQFQYQPPAALLEPRAIEYTTSGLHVAGQNDIFGGLSIHRLDAAGDLTAEGFWNEPDGMSYVRPLAMARTNEGGLVVGGYFVAPGEPDRRFLLETGVDLDVDWSVYPQSPPSESQWNAVCESPNGDVFALGSAAAPGGMQDQVDKYAPDGELIWSRALGEDEWASSRDVIACDETGGAIVAGNELHEVWYARLAP